jgi:small-conductance mechanosensitive channel
LGGFCGSNSIFDSRPGGVALNLAGRWLLSKVFDRLLRGSKPGRSLQSLILRFVAIAVWIIGLLLAAMIVFPGLTPAKALGGMGIASVAIGFAFRDIFENFFDGVLLLWRFPFENGDYIERQGTSGRVEDISIRMTTIRLISGELVVMPNSVLFKNPVEVLTSQNKRRVTIITGVAYSEDVEQAVQVIQAAIENCDSVKKDEEIQVFPQAFGSSSIDIEVAWWTDPRPLDIRRSRGEVVKTVKCALEDAGIEIPFPYRTLTFKDSLRTQTVNPVKESKEKKSYLFWFVSADLLSYLTVMPIRAYRQQVGQRGSMRIKILNFWYRLQASFWFVPALMTAAAILLSFVTTAIDRKFLYREDLQQLWIYSGGSDGARTVLSVITASMISVAGVVFSITIVVLSLASSQFGPRLIKNFMNVRANQMVLGTFVATFAYGVLVLRTVNATIDERFVPGISVSIAIVMSLFGLGVLIYFIHSVSESIQAQNIIARVRRDLNNAVDRIFPERLGRDDDLSLGPIQRDYNIPKTCDSEACQIKAERSGYLQAIDNDALMRIAGHLQAFYV